MSQRATSFDPPQGSLRSSVGRGALVTLMSQVVMMVTQVASVVTLSRLLSPEDFGLVAMCAPIIALLGMLQDFGLIAATVQKADLRREEVNFLFWVNIGISVSLTLLLIATAPLIALFYNEPRITALIMALAVIIALNGLGAQHAALLHRRMAYRALAVISVLGAVSSLAVAAVWALIAPSYWALFGGSLAGTLVLVGSNIACSRWRPGLPRRIEGWRGLLGFGAGITGFNLSNFFSMNLDKVMIGRAFGGVSLGYYDRAFKLVQLPSNAICNPLARVMIPALSRMADEPHRFRSAFERATGLMLLALLPGVACIIVMADVLIPLMFGENWTGAVAIFTALGFAALMQPVNNPSGWVFISQGRSGDFFRSGLLSAAGTTLAVLGGLPFGAVGIAVGLSVAEYVKTPLLWMLVGRSGPIHFRDVLRWMGPLVLAAHGAMALVWLARPLLPENAFWGLLSAGLLAYLVFIPLIALSASGRGTLAEAGRLIASRLPGRWRLADHDAPTA
ncbi:lipopolysaccharide biosynthesis protein [Cereibacter changlensis]|uniref:Lipopolysaccharide biosynthesis protein n=1 Tax=Cereibacter changlensis TaxID=402884 RepID=A0A4U0YYY7_9RHOB|nr:lipopolysaccharide biosynthesis protein [Cereibacter changlensis]MBZ4689034.1 hypothetical protein [Cereibacter sp.]TKA98130.1 lipopolysaccharide biosynthesis protein [Cereibacter changlensis]